MTRKNADADLWREGDDWRTCPRKCPKCGFEGFVIPDFGVRIKNGIEKKQSWCKTCRAGTNYHAQPRKYVKPD